MFTTRNETEPMADLYEPDYGTAFYRSRDPIKNLKIRVKLERVSSASIVPQAQLEAESGGNVEMKDIAMRQNPAHRDSEDFSFKWQEKVLSQREVLLYSDALNCNTVLERKYHEDAQLLQEVGRPTKRLFSYVAHDSFTNRDDNARKMTSSPNEEPTTLSEQMVSTRHRRAPVKKDLSMIPKVNIVEYKPSDDLKRQNHLLSTAFQTMYILVDLTPENKEPTEGDEFVLCTIKVDINGVISIRPDFNKGRKPYKIDSTGIGRDLFEYTIEHNSMQLNRQEQDRESKMYKELYSRHSEFLKGCVGHDFEMPPSDVLRMLICGEIVSAKNFEYDNLYVHYFVELPNGWHCPAPQQLDGVTQTCKTKVVGRDEVAYFSLPFQFELYYKKDILSDGSDGEALPKWPPIFVEVLSNDSWQRYRTEGYGWATLPTAPGSTTQEINCWRPIGRSVLSEMRRFFIGGTPELEDPTYAAVPCTWEGSRLSKFGFRTESTGSVTLRFNTVLQSRGFLQSAVSKKKMGTIRDRLGHTPAIATIMNVLEAFQQAKKRMVDARENLKQDYIETLKAYEADGPVDA